MFRIKNSSNFIISAPRSGTTWVSKMLNAHPQIFCVERRLFGNYADFVSDEGSDTPRLRITLDKYVNSIFQHHGFDTSEKETITQAIISTLSKQEKKLAKKNVIVDKITPYLNTSTLVLNQINNFFPKSNILFLVRDGRDVLTSGVFHWFNKQPSGYELNNFEKERRTVFLSNNDSKLERFFTDQEIEQWANEWAQPLREIDKAELSHNVLTIHFEDLLVDAKRELEKILLFFAVKKTTNFIDNCLDAGSFKKMSGGRKQGEAIQNAHIRKGISGDWKNYFTKQDAQFFHEIAGEELMKFGYVKNKSWIEELK